MDAYANGFRTMSHGESANCPNVVLFPFVIDCTRAIVSGTLTAFLDESLRDHNAPFLTHGSSEGRKGSHCYRSRCCYGEPTCTARVVHFVVAVVAQKPRSQQ